MADIESNYVIHAKWDADARVFYVESNVPGLNLEAPSIGELVVAIEDLLPVLLAANPREALVGKPRVLLEAELALA